MSNRDAIRRAYLLTSDTDLWPISRVIYDLPADRDVLSLNAFCCKPFEHKRKSYHMIPMSNIGARISTWRNLSDRSACTSLLD